ncbi:IclR family transcriptional regulator [Streptosporangium sp. NPDC087985]|uniref:IclR family transcriptional regulator n=1 Tax=Streptosporangium sp. NPDC087985 TaxID=3366196 RepID=UPI00381B262A
MPLKEELSHSLLDRVDLILSIFGVGERSMSLAELVLHTGLPKSTVYRTTERMVELGWLRREAGRYVVGMRLFEVANLATIRTRLREVSLPFMEDLYQVTHEAVHLAVLEDTHVLYAEEITGHRPATDLSRVGERMPAYCTAVGKVLIAFSPPEVLERVISRGLPSRTGAAITSPQRLRAEITWIKDRGVACDRRECDAGVAGVAAPVLDADLCAVGAISISGPQQRLHLERLVPAVRLAALAITRRMRRQPS